MKSIARLLVLVALAAAPAVAQQATQQQSPLQVTAVNRTAAELAARGTPRADKQVRTGDVVRYRLAFTNPQRTPVRPVLSNPIAPGMVFVAGSARTARTDARAEYSIDGGRTFSAQPMETVVVNGRSVQRAAAPEKYTHVRWTVGGFVAPGATVVAEFDVRFGGSPQTDNTASPAAGPSGR
ncbi:MAG TPA: hypothetical protein VF705_13955 [Longimicrobium sp.]|jgi:uncharacterized repeat protein (TIGR01451 family)